MPIALHRAGSHEGVDKRIWGGPQLGISHRRLPRQDTRNRRIDIFSQRWGLTGEYFGLGLASHGPSQVTRNGNRAQWQERSRLSLN